MIARSPHKDYEDLSWFMSTSRFAPPFDIVHYEGNLACFFEAPQTVATTDEVAFFRDVLARLQFLRRKHLALPAVSPAIFCRGDEEYVCKLSPRCLVVEDLDGSQLRANMRAMSKLAIFGTTRMRHAMNMIVDISSLLKHPVTWGFLKDSSLILQFMTYAHGTPLRLDQVKTRGRLNVLELSPILPLYKLIYLDADSKPNWAVDPGIIEDILEVKKANHQPPMTTVVFVNSCAMCATRSHIMGRAMKTFAADFPPPTSSSSTLTTMWWTDAIVGRM